MAAASQSQVTEVEHLIRLRSKERETAFAAALDTLAVYEQGLLVQSRATAESALAQYKVGRGGFGSVLEAHAGLLADQEGYLELLASAHRLLIAEGEISLNPTSIPSAPGGPGGAMPGAGGPSMSTSSAASVPAAPAGANPAGSTSGM